jgi:predicted ribosomally synthesized peptide with SipW-like signal peptide
MSSSTASRRRHRAPSRNRWVWVTALALAVAVVASVLGAGGTYALWNASASTKGAAVHSGTATLAVSPLPPMYQTVLGPGSSTTGTFTVRNTGTVPLSMRVAVTATKVSYANTTDDVVLGNQRLVLAAVGSSSECHRGMSGASGPLATFDTGSGYYTLPAGASAMACIEVALATDAPQSVSGAVTDFTLTVSGTQVAP